MTTAEALSSLSMEISAHLALPSVSLIAAIATETVTELAHTWRQLTHANDLSARDVVGSNVPSLPDASIRDVTSSLAACLGQAVGHGETTSTELEVMMVVRDLVKQNCHRSLAASETPLLTNASPGGGTQL